MRNKNHLLTFALIALGAASCDRDADRRVTENTTAREEPPAEPGGWADSEPMSDVDGSAIVNQPQKLFDERVKLSGTVEHNIPEGFVMSSGGVKLLVVKHTPSKVTWEDFAPSQSVNVTGRVLRTSRNDLQNRVGLKPDDLKALTLPEDDDGAVGYVVASNVAPNVK